MTMQANIHSRHPIDDAAASENHTFMIWAGWSGLAASAAYITTIVATSFLGSVEPLDGAGDIVRYLQDVAGNATRSYVYGIAGILMSILYLPFAAAWYSKLHRGAAAALGSAAMAIGLLLLIPAYAVSILEAAALASTATDLGTAGSEALFALHQFGDVTAAIFFTVGSILTLCLAPLLWSLDARRTGALPTWLVITGLLVGVTGLVWFVWLYESPIILIVLLANVVASLVFFIALARRLLQI